MAQRGRFGKYGDLKRKELIRSTRLSATGRSKELFASEQAVREDRLRKGHKKK